MGNQTQTNAKNNGNNRRRIVRGARDDLQVSRRYDTINNSLDLPPPHTQKDSTRRNYNSIDQADYESEEQRQERPNRNARMKSKIDREKDLVLKKLSLKNQQLRNQLKQISDQLTKQIKKKKLIPKKKDDKNDESNVNPTHINMAGLKRELENGYRQIDMYKRIIEGLKGKSQETQTDIRVKRIENSVSDLDSTINSYQKKIEGMKKIKKGQDRHIEKDINEDLVSGVASIKRQAQQIKNSLKEHTKRDRQRQVNYKKQQAYQVSVQRKWRQINGQYFPSSQKKNNPQQSRVNQQNPNQKQIETVTVKDFDEIYRQLNSLKSKHDDYHRRIDSYLLQKNKIVESNNMLEDNIKYSDKIIETLKAKLIEIKKIFKPAKKSLFGYDNYTGTELQSQINGGVSEIQKEIEEQINQDQFDIKHLLANIPKPIRRKPTIDFEEIKSTQVKKKNPREVSDNKGGMVISNQKSEPKKWGSSMVRDQEKGRIVKKQLVFDDSNQFDPDVKPLIIGINVWVNKNNAILGIQAIYLNNDEIRYGSKSSASADGFLQRYDLQSPDYLKNISGSFNQDGYVEYMVLYSKKGKVATFGNKSNQDQINFGLSSSERPFRIYGASFLLESESRINRIGINICQQ